MMVIQTWIKRSLLFKDRTDAGKFTIGICLGQQLAAKAFGARVYKSKRQKAEKGWMNDIRLMKGYEQHPSRHLFNKQTHILQWHVDTHTLPKEANIIASNGKYIQAFEIGNLLAIQSHPETNKDFLDFAKNLLSKEFYSVNAVMSEEEFKDGYKYADDLEKKTEIALTEWLKRLESKSNLTSNASMPYDQNSNHFSSHAPSAM